MKVKIIIIICFILTIGLSSYAQTFKIIGNDTVNRIDAKGQKQGRWIENERLNDAIGSYKNNKRVDTWRIYNYLGELDEEVKYVNGKRLNDNVKMRRIRAKFGDDDGVKMKMKDHFDIDFHFSDYSKEVGKIEYTNVTAKVLELKGDNYEQVLEFNSGAFSYIKNIPLQPNKNYKILLSLPGYLKREYLANTHLTSSTDSINNFVQGFNVAFYKKYNRKLAPEALKMPSNIMKYNKEYKSLTVDWRYGTYLYDKFESLDKSTKEKLITELDNTNNTEIIELQEQKKQQDEQINKLNSEKLLKESEARANKLEAQQKERELELISKEKLLQEFKIKEQQLEASQKAKEINLLNQNQLITELKLSGQELEIRQQNIEAEKKKQELKSSKLEQDKKTEEVRKEKLMRNFSLVGLLFVLGLVFFVYRSLRQNKKAKAIIEQQKQIVESQKHLVDEKQKEIIDSINYAKRIQYTLLAHKDFLSTYIPQYFVYFNPKDIVSGDFYWATKKGNKFYLAVCDSTGHGVPGAFMSLLNIGFLSEAINEKGIERPNDVFNYVRQKLVDNLSKDGQKDGFDGILICLNLDTKQITYSAANNKPILVKNNKFIELEADRMPVGMGERKEDFKLHTVDAQQGDILYLYTDGYADQFGGPKGKKFKYKPLNELIIGNHTKPLQEQKIVLQNNFDSWRGNLEQVDDVCVVGIKIS